MLFYCPNCGEEREAEPTNTITTNSNRVAFKAACPVCGQDMAEFSEFKHEVQEPGSDQIEVGPEETPGEQGV